MNTKKEIEAYREMEENFESDSEAFRLLDLINAEFQSDPMSTQCFDRRIVERVRDWVAKRKASARPVLTK